MKSCAMLCRSKQAALALIFIWFMAGGICHFIFPEAFARAVPPYVPYPLFIVHFTGVCEIAGAVGITMPRLRRLAGWGLFAFTLCVTPVNVYMWQHPELFPGVPPLALLLRLPLQAALLVCIWWGTRPAKA